MFKGRHLQDGQAMFGGCESGRHDTFNMVRLCLGVVRVDDTFNTVRLCFEG